MAAISYSTEGAGPPLILIHGFPMSRAVWSNTAKKLSKDFTVFTIDLPGFGESPPLAVPFTIEQVADRVIQWMNELHITKANIVGHSLGGYVTLSMIEKSPELFESVVLLHSTAVADNEEKKQSRNKVLEFIDKNGVQTFTSNFIAPLFADSGHPAIEIVRSIAVRSNASSVKGYTMAMRDRKDRTAVIASFPGKILLIGGEKDAGISPDSLVRQSKLSPRVQADIFPNVAHMGMFEAPEKTAEKIRSFLR